MTYEQWLYGILSNNIILIPFVMYIATKFYRLGQLATENYDTDSLEFLKLSLKDIYYIFSDS